MIARFRNFLRAIAPRWLSEGEGKLVLTSLGLTIDAVVEHALRGLEARFPERAPTDALAALGRDRKIVRGLTETDAVYAARLLRWLDDWRVAGNPYALMEQLRAFLGVDLMIRTVDNSGNWYTIAADGTRSVNLEEGNWDWDGDADKWSRFWVILYPPSSLWTYQTWGSWTWGDGSTWGTTATVEEVSGVRTIVRTWKPAGTRCPYIIVAFDANSFNPSDPPGAPLPDGTWGQWSKNSGGTQVPARLTTARYWKGTS